MAEVKPQVGDPIVSELDAAYDRYRNFVITRYGWKPMTEAAWTRADAKHFRPSVARPAGIRLQTAAEHRAQQARIRAGLSPL